MGETDRTDVLRRKARSGREEHQARVMSPTRALRLAMARSADELFEMALSVSSIKLEQVSQAEALAAFSDENLLMVLDGPQGAIGAASVEIPILAGLIEMQTMGRVLPGAAETRAPTQTDAALVAPLLDASLEGFVENLDGTAEARWAEEVRFGARVESARMLSLLVEAADFHLFRLNVALGEGAKEGGIVIALPVLLPGAPESSAGDAAGSEGRLLLGQGALLVAEAPLNAVLHRIRMPLAEVSQLKPGERLTIPRAALNDTRLEAGGMSSLRNCRLGQINGFRAVRLSAGADSARLAGGPETRMDEDDEAEEVGAGLRQLPGGLPGEMTDLADGDQSRLIAEAEAEAADQAQGRSALPDLSQPTADLPDLGDLGDLGDPGEYGDLGEFGDLSELALGE